MTDIHTVAAAKRAFELAERRAAKCAKAQYALNELHKKRAAELTAAKKAYEKSRDDFVTAEMARADA